MKPLNLLQFALFALVLTVFAGCSKNSSTSDTPDPVTELIAFCNESHDNGVWDYLRIRALELDDFPYDADHTEANAEKVTFYGSGDVTYSFEVKEVVPNPSGGVLSSSNKSYTGTLKESAFNKGKVNTLEIARSGSDWKILVNGADAETTGGNNNGGNNNGGTSGVWQRFNSPNGYNTDLAIGGIKGEPENRVYMCEHPGSPTAGLYKGYISGETITWDAVHGLPNAKFYERDGVMRLWFTVGAEDDAGRYKKGTWTNTCGALENSVKKIVVGYNNDDMQSYTVMSVTIEGVKCNPRQYSATLPLPDCTSGSYINTPTISGDYYNVSIVLGGNGVSGPYTTTFKSILYKSELTSDCNKLKIAYAGATWALAPL
ncbi:MAG: hypothetical protein H6550_07420 [Chitinophagales bacterium]|nr:hypothetical protein [Chitinophagales bacterium]